MIQSGSAEELVVDDGSVEAESAASPSCSRAAASCLFLSSWSASQLRAPHIRLSDLPWVKGHTQVGKVINEMNYFLSLSPTNTHTHRSSWAFKDANFALLECTVQSLHELLLDVVGLVGKWKHGPAILHSCDLL